MGIPGLINAIGAGERVSLSKLAIAHLERTARPIRVAVDISIWLFQVQAGRGGRNPELRTLFYRLLKLLVLPIHPLFVYDGRHKPPFKRGKAVSARSYGNAPIIQRSKDLIERFRFPWHEAPGEAEAECARLQQAGIVDAVMSNDVDALMFGSTLTIMNFSKESGSGTTASTHVTCYAMGKEGHPSNVPLDRAGMILFAMLSGGDYLPSGVPKCGSKLAAEIAKAGFGEDLLQQLASNSSDLDSGLAEWRERLQYELEENESGYFVTKHKVVRIPDSFPDRTILEYYAQPKVSSNEEMAVLRLRLKQAWDRDIDPLAIRTFAAEHFEWNYRSGARKVIKLLAEPLVCYKLRLQRPVSALPLHQSLAPNCDTPMLQKVYRSRANFGTDGTTELQMDMLPIDVVGIDLLAEEPNPPPPSQEILPSQSTVGSGAMQSGDEDEDPELVAESAPPTPSKTRIARRFDPFAMEKVWIFETVARLGVPDVVKKWEDEQAQKAQKPAPKKSSNRRSAPKKKGPIDSGMKRGSILKYGTLTKEKSDLSASKQTHLLEAASTPSAKDNLSSFKNLPSYSESLEEDPFALNMYTHQGASSGMHTFSREVDELLDPFSSLCSISSSPNIKRHPMAAQSRVRSQRRVLGSGEIEIADLDTPVAEIATSPLRSALPRGIKMSYSVSSHKSSTSAVGQTIPQPLLAAPSPKTKHHTSPKKREKVKPTSKVQEAEELEKAIESLSLSVKHDNSSPEDAKAGSKHRSSPKKALEKSETYLCSSTPQPAESPRLCETTRPMVGHSASITESVNAPEKPQYNGHLTPSTGRSCTGTHTRKRTQKFKDLDNTKDSSPEPPKSSNHIENITAHGGFWSVDTLDVPVSVYAGPCADSTALQNHTEHSPTKQDRKKRVPRVSILDLI
ncbi:hypothetical protein NUU61_003325 [Penicillium alfredii]|uniref:XPG-I domain-containing protein n=1 Tax=Penicillium alfredii TaxID=1506179 RepID=A0A9W9FTB5_9EURO|nr:uncharacterized protein NUU61_003325 [Penicillium alfredii]KAJ5105978.1 hypothetical protein NUU61_003325 [Penicillium alfredii]